MTVRIDELTHRNDVLLVGRVSGQPTRRELPSGDVVVGIRVVVERAEPPPRPRMARVDAIDCVAWSTSCRRIVCDWQPGDVVEVVGSLRRRFWRHDARPVSRYEVEIRRGRLLNGAGGLGRPVQAADTVGPDL